MPDRMPHIENALGDQVSARKSLTSPEGMLEMLGKLSEKSDALTRSSGNLKSAVSNLDAASSELRNMSSAKILAWKAKRAAKGVWNSFKNALGGTDGNPK